METLYIIYFFICGTVFGSFYNVVGYRVPKGMSIIHPGSHCPSCNHKLTSIELIPILSYIIQGGKCKNCKTHIPMFYPCFELMTGLLFVVAYLIFGLTWQLLIAVTFLSILIIVILSDFKYMIIPDELLLVGIIMIIAEKSLLFSSTTAFNALISGIVAFAVMLFIQLLGDFIFKKESLGGGDIKLMFFIGLCLPLPISVLPIFLGTFIALPISIIMMIIKKDHMLAFGPYLSVAAIALFLLQVTSESFYQIILKLS